MTNLLFICNNGNDRSKTASEIFSNKFSTDCLGIFHTENLASTIKEKIQWADIIITMENLQKDFITKKYPKLSTKKKIINWEIESKFSYNQPQLVQKLREHMEQSGLLK